jgi:hypothetical protein
VSQPISEKVPPEYKSTALPLRESLPVCCVQIPLLFLEGEFNIILHLGSVAFHPVVSDLNFGFCGADGLILMQE